MAVKSVAGTTITDCKHSRESDVLERPGQVTWKRPVGDGGGRLRLIRADHIVIMTRDEIMNMVLMNEFDRLFGT